VVSDYACTHLTTFNRIRKSKVANSNQFQKNVDAQGYIILNGGVVGVTTRKPE
jgi:hypothetical protein